MTKKILAAMIASVCMSSAYANTQQPQQQQAYNQPHQQNTQQQQNFQQQQAPQQGYNQPLQQNFQQQQAPQQGYNQPQQQNFQQQQAPQKDETINPNIVLNARDEVQTMINDWKDSPEGEIWQEQMEMCGAGGTCLQIFEGIANAKGDLSSPQFGEIRSLAFAEALQQAQSQNARSQLVQASVEVIGQLTYSTPSYDDKICDGASPENKERLLQEKALLLADQWMTNKLKEEGVPDESIPKQIDKINSQKRIELFSDAISQTSTQKSGSTQGKGFVILKNFEAVDKNNQVAVAVIIVSAPQIMQMLNAMKESKGQFNPEMYQPIGMIPRLNQSVNSYVRQNLAEGFGARLVYNQQGYPTLIGIGQASQIAKTNDPREEAVYQRVAQESAQQNAINSISQLFDMQTSLEVTVSDEAKFSKNAVAEYVGCNLASTNEDTALESEYSKFLNVKQESKTNTSLKGLKNLRNDNYYHPSLKRKIYYSAYTWSPQTEMAVRNYQQEVNQSLKKKPLPAQPQANSVSNNNKAAPVNQGYRSQSQTSLKPDF